MTPIVSVILPAFNAAAFLGRAISSMRAQTFDDWELIVVDDGSRDKTAQVAEVAAAGDMRIRCVRIDHGGIVAALNTGIAEAHGRFIARMDADDEMSPRRLAEQVALLEAQSELGVASCLVAFGGDRAAARGYALHVDWINTLVEPAEIAHNRFVESPVAHPSVMFRRELVERHGGYRDGAWPEDYELWLRWMDAGVLFAKVPEVLLRWNDPPERLSRRHPRYAIESFYACKCHYLARWLQREVSPSRAIWLWGAGRITRRRFRGLVEASVDLAGYIDIDARKAGRVIGGRPVIVPDALPSPETCFVISGVGTRGARELIRAALVARGFREGTDFLMAA